MKPDLLFVYGTLRSGDSRNDVLEGCERLETTTIKGYSLYDLGPFPALKKEMSNNPVVGEVYRVTDPALWRTLDVIEGHPNFYERTLIMLEDTERTPCWTYIYKGTEPGMKMITSGDWFNK